MMRQRSHVTAKGKDFLHVTSYLTVTVVLKQEAVNALLDITTTMVHVRVSIIRNYLLSFYGLTSVSCFILVAVLCDLAGKQCSCDVKGPTACNAVANSACNAGSCDCVAGFINVDGACVGKREDNSMYVKLHDYNVKLSSSANNFVYRCTM